LLFLFTNTDNYLQSSTNNTVLLSSNHAEYNTLLYLQISKKKILSLAAFRKENSLVSALRRLDYIFRSRGIILSQFRFKSTIQSAQSAY